MKVHDSSKRASLYCMIVVVMISATTWWNDMTGVEAAFASHFPRTLSSSSLKQTTRIQNFVLDERNSRQSSDLTGCHDVPSGESIFESSEMAIISTTTTTTTLFERRKLMVQSFCSILTALSISMVPSFPAQAAYIDPNVNPPTITDKVYLDVEWINSSIVKTGRIVIGVFGDVMPKTSDNFVTLCRQNAYAGTSFYRIISDYSIQGGAIGDSASETVGNKGRSSFDGGVTFEPDNYNLQHTQKGLVSMVKAKSGGVDSRFFIQVKDDAGWADDRYAAFGIVLDDGKSLQLVDTLEQLPVQPPRNNPKQPVKIVTSGVL